MNLQLVFFALTAICAFRILCILLTLVVFIVKGPPAGPPPSDTYPLSVIFTAYLSMIVMLVLSLP